MFEDEKKPAPTAYQLGQSLEQASLAELEKLLARLEAEMERVRQEMERKKASAAAAESFFRKD